MTGEPPRITKTKSDVNLIEMQFANPANMWLLEGEIIDGAQVVEATLEVGISSITNTTTQVLFYIGSGSLNEIYHLEVLVQTNAARNIVRSFQLEIVDYKYVQLGG